MPPYLTYYDQYYGRVYPGDFTGYYYPTLYVMVVPATSSGSTLASDYPYGAYTWNAANYTVLYPYYYPYGGSYSAYYSLTFTATPGQNYMVVAFMAPIYSWDPYNGYWYQYTDGYGSGYAALSSGWTLVPTATAPLLSGSNQTINLTMQPETY
jgi:hypothetical protein